MIRDILISGAIKALKPLLKEFVNKKVDEYGSIQDLDFSYEKKELQLSLILKGETELLYITLSGLGLDKLGEKYLLSIKKVSASRKWIDTLAKNWLAGKFGHANIEIPEKIGVYLNKVL